MELFTLQERVLNFLKTYQTPHTEKSIANRFDSDWRTIAFIITELRKEGHPIESRNVEGVIYTSPESYASWIKEARQRFITGLSNLGISVRVMDANNTVELFV